MSRWESEINLYNCNVVLLLHDFSLSLFSTVYILFMKTFFLMSICSAIQHLVTVHLVHWCGVEILEGQEEEKALYKFPSWCIGHADKQPGKVVAELALWIQNSTVKGKEERKVVVLLRCSANEITLTLQPQKVLSSPLLAPSPCTH